MIYFTLHRPHDKNVTLGNNSRVIMKVPISEGKKEIAFDRTLAVNRPFCRTTFTIGELPLRIQKLKLHSLAYFNLDF